MSVVWSGHLTYSTQLFLPKGPHFHIWGMDRFQMLSEPSTAYNLMEMGAPKTLVAVVIWLQ